MQKKRSNKWHSFEVGGDQTHSSADIRRGLIYSKPSNSDWSIFFTISLKSKQKIRFLPQKRYSTIYVKGKSQGGYCTNKLQKQGFISRMLEVQTKVWFSISIVLSHFTKNTLDNFSSIYYFSDTQNSFDPDRELKIMLPHSTSVLPPTNFQIRTHLYD